MIRPRTFLFIGTTAELIKLAPIIKEFNRHLIPFTIIASGQNDIHFEEFPWVGKVHVIRAVTPKGKKNSIVAFIIWSARTFFSLLVGMRSNFNGLHKTNSLFIVHGDTVSSLMGSLVAALYGLKLVHIESGLRSFDYFEPFPEELCRVIISRLADIHFAPNAWALKNLSGLRGEKVNTGENTLIETFWTVMHRKSKHHIIKRFQKTKYFVLVVHRQEHVLFAKDKTKKLIGEILQCVPNHIHCLFLIHDISTSLIDSLTYVIPNELTNHVTKIRRLSYGDFMHLLTNAEFMITDGGSNQEELYYMGKPCLLLRRRTERREGLGDNVVLSHNSVAIIKRFVAHYRSFRRPAVRAAIPPSRIIRTYLFGS